MHSGGACFGTCPLPDRRLTLKARTFNKGEAIIVCALSYYRILPMDGSKAVDVGAGPRFVHIVDDDASFRTAMERRLKHAGYEVATYASAQHLAGSLAERKCARAASSSTCGYRD